MLPPPPQQPLILLPCSKHQEIFGRNTNTNTKACKCSIRHYRSTSTNFWFGFEGWEVQTQRDPTWRNAGLNFLQKNFFLQLRLLFQFNQTLPQRSQTVHIRKQMNIRKVPLFLSSLPPPVLTCSSFYFCFASTWVSNAWTHEQSNICSLHPVKCAAKYFILKLWQVWPVLRKEKLGKWRQTKWV